MFPLELNVFKLNLFSFVKLPPEVKSHVMVVHVQTKMASTDQDGDFLCFLQAHCTAKTAKT